MMKVEILTHTENPDDVIARAVAQCHQCDGAYDLDLPEEEQKRLIAMILKNGHLSCLEHASITYSVSGISRACSHQLVRHRMASYSQQSQRYTLADDDYVIPESIKKQEPVLRWYMDEIRNIEYLYASMVAAGIPKEDARYILPNAATTSIVVTMNFRELLHFFDLRTSKGAQWEIRELAEKMHELAKEVSPTVFEED